MDKQELIRYIQHLPEDDYEIDITLEKLTIKSHKAEIITEGIDGWVYLRGKLIEDVVAFNVSMDARKGGPAVLELQLSLMKEAKQDELPA